MADIAKFTKLNISPEGEITLKLNFELEDDWTYSKFSIDELRDFMAGNNTNVSANEQLIKIELTTYPIKYPKGIVQVPCIEMTTDDNYKEQIFEDDDFFFTDFLKLNVRYTDNGYILV